MNANILSLPAGPDLPDIWLPAVRGQLAAGENLLGWLELDLDAELRFAHGLIALTDRRLLSWGEAGGAARAWPLSAAPGVMPSVPLARWRGVMPMLWPRRCRPRNSKS